MSTILTMLMTIFGISTIGGAPLAVSAMIGLKSIPSYVLIAWAIAPIVALPIQKLSMKIPKDTLVTH